MAALAPSSARKRPLFRFSLRAALVSLTAACLFLGGYVKQVRDQKDSREKIRACGGTAYLDYQWAAASASNKLRAQSPPKPPNFLRLRELLGDDFFSNVVAVTVPYHLGCEIDTSALLAFRRLRLLNLSGTHLGDDDLRKIAGMISIEELRLADTDVTDDGIQWIVRLPRLKILSLRGTVISDTGLRMVSQQTSLQELDASDTNATKEGLDHLKVALCNCRVTTGLAATRKGLTW
jgi:Leucine Rich repeat